MQENKKQKVTIGRAERVAFPLLGGAELYARIDTGAKTSSIWASDVTERADGLAVRFMSPQDDIYQQEIVFRHYDKVRVASSMGHQQVRYRIKLPIILKGRRIVATFTLSDRSTQVYPVLIGRSTLHGKFIVDVTKGTPLKEKEAARTAALQANITEEQV